VRRKSFDFGGRPGEGSDPERPKVAFGAFNATKAAFGAFNATKAALGRIARPTVNAPQTHDIRSLMVAFRASGGPGVRYS
jgi:hypothetical protein